MKNSFWFFLLLLSSCKTSGDIRAEKGSSSDPVGVKTVSNPALLGGATSVSSSVHEDMLREMEMIKGQLQEQSFLHEQEKKQLQSRIDVLESERQRLIEEIQILKGRAPELAAQGADLMWQRALKDMQAKNYRAAATSFKDFAESFPQDPKLESAFILRGQNEYAAEMFKEALVSFGRYLDKYPKGNHRAMAWLGQGVSLIRLKQIQDSKLFLEQCVSLFPKTKEANLAAKLLKTPKYVPPTIFL
jgi:TolA-binding protein